MVTVEERVSHLEAQVDDLSETTTEIKSMLVALDQKMDRRFDTVDRRFDALEGRIESRFGAFDARFGGLETRNSQSFLSMLTLQIMTLLAIIGGLLGIITS